MRERDNLRTRQREQRGVILQHLLGVDKRQGRRMVQQIRFHFLPDNLGQDQAANPRRT